MIKFRRVTWGAEHEWADIPRNELLPIGFGWDAKDITIVNSNGIANDPKGELYAFGGEIQTMPTETIDYQVALLTMLKERYGMATVNYRSNLHVHIRVPGLSKDLEALKRFAQYNNYWLPKVLPVIEPIPIPSKEDYPQERSYAGAMRRYRRRRRSHHTTIPDNRVARQSAALTLEEFFRLEVPTTQEGVPMWHAQARAAVNLRQLMQTDTVEFRHFPGTLDEEEFRDCLEWVQHYTRLALVDWTHPEEANPLATYLLGEAKFPTFAPYDHALEVRYRATCHDGTLSKEQIAANIAAILDGSFDDAYWDNAFAW